MESGGRLYGKYSLPLKFMKRRPLISVLMPVYNGSRFIGEAIESILAQTYRNFELLIVDDGSTDDTWKKVRQYQKLHPRLIRAWRRYKNRGAYEATNVAFARAKGQFIALMDSDDVAFPDRFEKQVEFLKKNPGVIVLGGQANVINQLGEIIGRKILPTGHKEVYKAFGFVHPMVHPSCMIRKSLLPKGPVLYNPVVFGVNCDYFAFFKLLNRGKFANLPDTILNYRVHLGNSSLADIKGCFINTVKIRLLAIRDLKYKPSLGAVIMLLAQFVVVVLTPRRLLLGVYLMLRGIYSPKLRLVLSFPVSPTPAFREV